MELNRVVITGMGCLTPLGKDVPSYFDALKRGVSGAGPITRFDASKFKTQVACEIKDWDPREHFDRKARALSTANLPDDPLTGTAVANFIPVILSTKAVHLAR